MEQFIVQYPRGGYTANAQYWLGELYMVKKIIKKQLVILTRYFNNFLHQTNLNQVC